MDKVKLNKKKVELVFAMSSTQEEYISRLYRMVFPDWDSIETIEGWPHTNKATSQRLFALAMEHDSKYSPQYFRGGAWMNRGFGSYEDSSLEDWAVDLRGVTVKHKEAPCLNTMAH